MNRCLKFCFPALAALLAGLFFIRASEASPRTPEQTRRDLEMISMLSEFKARLADDWTLVFKNGLSFGLSRGDADGAPADQRAEVTLEILEPMFQANPAEDPEALKKIITAHKEIREAEKKLIRNIERNRNAVAQALLGNIRLLQIRSSIQDKTEALVLGRKPVKLPYREPAGGGQKADLDLDLRPPLALDLGRRPCTTAKRDESGRLETDCEAMPVALETMRTEDSLPDPPKEIKASQDPETLRLAYEAQRELESLYWYLRDLPQEMQLAMYSGGEYPSPDYHYDLKRLEKVLEIFKRLPDLTEQEKKMLDELPGLFEQMGEVCKEARVYLEERKKMLFDLGRLVESTFNQADNLRLFYINRLREAAQ